MGYRNLHQCVRDLEKHGHLLRCAEPVSGRLEIAEIQRRCYLAGAPAVLFERVDQCRFPVLGNLFGSLERARFIFRDTLESVRRAVELKIDPQLFFRKPVRYVRAPLTALYMRPQRTRRAAVMRHECQLNDLPQIVSWPSDGGPFVTLPQVYSEDARAPGLRNSNLGMYRVQLAGNDYEANREVGLHYQIHRGIGVHHQAAIAASRPFRVNIFVGGAPAMTVSAVMPLPEGMSELGFAGALAGHRIPMTPFANGHLYSEADFCITGIVDPTQQKLEGPFGDHLGYYSLQHEFPVLKVEKVFHRNDAIWPFTVVGRPPQEDTTFGQLIHEITGPILPTVLPGVKQVHAVDAAGVHPLLLAIGSERYVPYRKTSRPSELLTQANAILGQGQLSLAKYLWIIDEACVPKLDLHDISDFFVAHLQRVDWRRDLHFQTETTIDTLDYSGTGLNQGSKVVIAAAGEVCRQLSREIPSDLRLPTGFSNPQVCLPGVLAIQAPRCENANAPSQKANIAEASGNNAIQSFCDHALANDTLGNFPLIVMVDDSPFTAKNLSNFLWTVFTRSNPATDIYGVGASTINKHWGCRGSLVIDARIKPHHAPPLIEDPEVTKRVDALAAKPIPLAKYL
jgi:4-hydroxy-3-polyprenylbenzoate decarboxylase